MKRELDVQNWGNQRGITIVTEAGLKKRVTAQLKKLRSEFDEMVRDDTQDDIGDQLVVLSMIASLLDTTATRCRHAVRDMLPTIPVYEDGLVTSVESELNSLEWIVEICDMKHDRVEVLKAVGFYVDALERYCVTKGWKLEDCLEVAWNDIKDRDGCMISDIFVKGSNLALLEMYGITVQKDDDGQFILEGFVLDHFTDLACNLIDSLGYTYHMTEAGYSSDTGTLVTLITTCGVSE